MGQNVAIGRATCARTDTYMFVHMGTFSHRCWNVENVTRSFREKKWFLHLIRQQHASKQSSHSYLTTARSPWISHICSTRIPVLLILQHRSKDKKEDRRLSWKERGMAWFVEEVEVKERRRAPKSEPREKDCVIDLWWEKWTVWRDPKAAS